MPTAWGYSNGAIPFSAMRQVRGEYFEPHAAYYMQLMELAAERELGHQIPITEGFRALGSTMDEVGVDTQWGLWKKYLRDGYPIAARPGTSNHGQGQAADMGGAASSFGTVDHNWIVNNAPRFNWRWGSTPAEAWHIDYYGPVDGPLPTTTTATSGTATPISEEEDDMPKYQLVQAVGDSTIYLTGPVATFPVPNPTWYTVLAKYIDAVNKNEAPALTKGQWEIVKVATGGKA